MNAPVAVAPGVRGVPVRSPTLPPATHTNVWVLGHSALTVVDPASPWAPEQQRLHQELLAFGAPIERIVLTHHHGDHVSGAVDLAQRTGAPILAHPETARRLPFATSPLPEVLDAGGLAFDVHLTAGHAPGHVVLHERTSGLMVAGDMVAGVGTIAIDPDDAGHLGTYLASLTAMRALRPTALLPAHGPVLQEADALLAFYLAHRHGRSDQIHRALIELGASTPLQIAPRVYAELDARFHPLAAVQIRAHLIWLAEHARARHSDGRWTAT